MFDTTLLLKHVYQNEFYEKICSRHEFQILIHIKIHIGKNKIASMSSMNPILGSKGFGTFPYMWSDKYVCTR